MSTVSVRAMHNAHGVTCLMCGVSDPDQRYIIVVIEGAIFCTPCARGLAGSIAAVAAGHLDYDAPEPLHRGPA